MIRCRVARRLIDAALERELGLEPRLELEGHTARCMACAEHERRARALQELLEGPGDPPPIVPDVDAAARAVLATLERGEGRAWQPRRRRQIAFILGAALALAASLALSFWLRERSRPRAGVPPSEEVAAPEAVADPDWTPASVEALVRAALLESFGTSGADEERARLSYCKLTRAVFRAGWPVRRFVEGLLEDPDTAVALAAVRCFAILGEHSAAPALERALGRTDLAEAALDALGALALLGAQGEPALTVLERALGEPELAPRALLQLCRVGGERAARGIERAVQRAGDPSIPSREALLDALTATGPAAVASLMHLAAEENRRAESTAILARLALVEGGGLELARVLAGERFAGDLAYRALLVAQPVEAIPWLEERCGSSRERALALETLANYPGSEPLAAALRLAESGRTPREDVLGLLVGLFERDGERADGFSQGLAKWGPNASTRTWLTLLIESEHPCAARALVPLVFTGRLADDERMWAALAVGELGTPGAAQELLLELRTRVGVDRRLTAACLLSIHTLLGAAGVEQWLAPCSPPSVRRVLLALDSQGRSGEAVRVHRVARALDGALAELSPSTDKKATP